MGDVYLKCPLSGEILWHDWCSHSDYVNRYGNYDMGRFLWVSV